MAKQRYINTRFWDDGYIITLDPIEKLLFLYFLTNPLTEISGAYEIPLRRIAFDTGIDSDMVLKIVRRFADEDKIIYRDGWVLICNFIKHQSVNPKITTGIEKSVNGCPDWVKDRLSIAYQSLSHLNSNSNPNPNASGFGLSPSEKDEEYLSGRRGIVRDFQPVTPAAAKLDEWMEAVAEVMGAKSAATMANRKKWEPVCIAAIKEGHTLDKFLEATEAKLTAGEQYFSPDKVLTLLQSQRSKKAVSKFFH